LELGEEKPKLQKSRINDKRVSRSLSIKNKEDGDL